MHYARRGEIAEMEFVALREDDAEIGAERGGPRPAIIPSNITTRCRSRISVAGSGEDQRQYGNSGFLLDRGGGGEDDVGHPRGGRHHHGSSTGKNIHETRDVDPAQSRRCPWAPCRSTRRREGELKAVDLTWEVLPRHPHRASRAGRGLLHDPRRRGCALHPAHPARHLHRLRGARSWPKWCLAHSQESFLYTHFRDICRSWRLRWPLARRRAAGCQADPNDDAQFRRSSTPWRATTWRGSRSSHIEAGPVPMHLIRRHRTGSSGLHEAPFYTPGPAHPLHRAGLDHITSRRPP